jgi:hypothetical protein
MTKKEFKELKAARETAFPRREGIMVMRTPLQRALDRIPDDESWKEPIEAKQERWSANLRREIAEGL